MTVDLGRPFTYADGLPGHAHAETSVEAARAIVTKLAGDERVTYTLLVNAGSDGLTDQELEDLAGESDTRSLRPRRVSLCKKHLVADSGRRRAAPGHRAAIVWIAVPLGQQGKLW